ncbi:MAG: ankyrin repeat domain-containing protein [Oscillospiraceae bacterium]|nr:ankyrin repeat domain-containing protein [Oscillospiraceae bacterium]
MATKKKTLPKDFQELIKARNLDALVKAMVKCEPNATGDYNKYNAFSYEGVTEEFAKWLVEYGTDINMPDKYGYTPLHYRAMRRNSREQLELYIRLGADMNKQGSFNGGPLHGAASYGIAENVQVLIAAGADVLAKTKTPNPEGGDTALEFALSRCRGGDIVEKIDAVELLIRARVPVTEKVKEHAKRIAADIEFHRADFAEEWAGKVDASLERLYDLTGITPAKKRRIHDGKSPITVTAKTWREQYAELWEMLVPGSGSCQTMQGEAIRVIGRVTDELLNNGGGNWDKDYCTMLESLKAFFSMGMPLDEVALEEVGKLCAQVSPDTDCEAALQCLQQMSVRWVLKNQEPIALGKPAYRR